MKVDFDDYGKIEDMRDALYPNPLEEAPLHIICPNCGEQLYDGDVYYPSIGICEYCLPDYKEVVNIQLEDDEMTLAHRLIEEN